MGKGSRNRQLHQQDRMENPKKYKEAKRRKPTPKWVTPLVCIVLLVAVVIGVGASVFSKYGIVKRSRIVLESQTGKFDVTQQIATFIAWQTLYSNAAMYWTYCDYGLIEDKDKIADNYTIDQYALSVAQISLDTQLRDSIDDVVDALRAYVAVCDAAHKAGVKLDADNEARIQKTMDSLNSMKDQYGYSSLNSFLATAMGKGMRVSDVEKALEMIELYDKYCTMMEVEYEKVVTIGDLEGFRNANPESFFMADYLMFAADNKEFADELKATTSAEAFKDLVLNHHFNENYKTVYNKFTTVEAVGEKVEYLSTKTDANGGTALTEALNSSDINADALKEFTPENTENEDLKKWLFDKARKQYEVGTAPTEDGIYLVVFFSEAASETSVQARIKFYEFVDGKTHGEDVTFKESILKYLQESKKDEPSYPEVPYIKAEKRAEDFEKLLKEATDVTALLKEYHAVEVKDVSDSTDTKKIPEEIRNEVTGAIIPEVGDILTVDDGAVSYVVYIDGIDKTSDNVDLRYVTFESDLYYQITHDLTSSLASVYPTDKVANFVKDAAKDSFEAWIFELADDKAMTSAREEFETKVVETTKDSKTTYNVYMVINKPMYVADDISVNGGYYLFTGTDYRAKAEAALAAIQGKDYANALKALQEQASGATISPAITETSMTDTNMKNWMLSDERQKGDVALIDNKSGNGCYVLVFVEKQEAWKNNAKDGFLAEKVENWISDLVESYTVNENVLDKFGQPTPETSATTTAATTTAKAAA